MWHFVLFVNIFAENCMKMKEIGMGGGEGGKTSPTLLGFVKKCWKCYLKIFSHRLALNTKIRILWHPRRNPGYLNLLHFWCLAATECCTLGAVRNWFVMKIELEFLTSVWQCLKQKKRHSKYIILWVNVLVRARKSTHRFSYIPQSRATYCIKFLACDACVKIWWEISTVKVRTFLITAGPIVPLNHIFHKFAIGE